jgi:threonine/homoserine/homoserine lactone efflux protein
MVLRQTLVGGARCAMASVVGNSSGLIIWGTAAAAGLSQVFAHSPLAYNILKFSDVAYLSYLALSTVVTLRRESGAFDTNGAAVFAVAFISQFVPRSFPLGPGVVLLALVQALVSLGWYTALVATVHRAATNPGAPHRSPGSDGDLGPRPAKPRPGAALLISTLKRLWSA